eukprot:TRINITY_DN3064_c1_g1_i1.p1 TRINITY_DN3064_c1_g1~~TRINITY_DN3064_c1_g1_i1.p1  ORF type:complete len:565 (-),score=185.11 TRINITY_DN3064_c1_g1_i1:1422-3116(-)
MKLIVIGACAVGCGVACRARRLDEHAEIILLEKDQHPSFANCGLPYYIGGEIEDRDDILVTKPNVFPDRFGIDLRVRHEGVEIDRVNKKLTILDHINNRKYEETYDKLVISTGSRPRMLPVEGLYPASNVYTLRNLTDADQGKSLIKRGGNAIVVGSGFIGLEVAEQYKRAGMNVTVVSYSEMPLFLNDMEMTFPITKALKMNKINIRYGQTITSVERDGDKVVEVTLTHGEKLPCDLCIVAIGVEPNNKLAKEAGLELLGRGGHILVNEYQQTSDENIYAAGDNSVYPTPWAKQFPIPLAGPANKSARIIGHNVIRGNEKKMPVVMGSSVVRVFDVTFASTGLSESQLTRMNIPHKVIVSCCKNHAGYYPKDVGTIVLKLCYDPTDGKILGAQCVGEVPGVEKRIDVIATCMHFDGTVYDLSEVDLCYSPPFGCAKDPVHEVSFAAMNQIEGLHDFVYINDPMFDKENVENYLLVDLRNVEEIEEFGTFKAHPSFERVHIPLDELRKKLYEIPKDRKILVHCASGKRSYFAYRMLKQLDYDVTNINGSNNIRLRYFMARKTLQ